MNISTLNWAAVFVAALSCFLIGGIWYSALFTKAWMKANNITKDDSKRGNMGKIFGLAFLWSLVMSFNLAMYLNAPGTTMSWGATAGLLAGLGWVSMAFFIVGLFERRSTAYMLIHAGYFIVSFVVMGAILGAWR
ncbi:MAG: DUF1761 domain-containing protein [Bacteroidota bacterium]|nr:DUF1761 domain-containing protein [Bacteroidota bacterium]MDP4217716.1 DUF1761 domain-containing protein [Bacteroidota bacterium]MDP4247542.1 DUF1761 domain-containing protein [Bacteroidota bacterium]MDP4254150.1 DUF1761 domain-containing protein [Bacteroidota bacterium]MDP4259638.1 DUF1761 domain-containing protein [Bacteroidota bacterium]